MKTPSSAPPLAFSLQPSALPSSLQPSALLSIQGWFDFADIYSHIVRAAPRGSTLVEIGVWKGASLCWLGLLAKQSGKDLRIIGIDRWVHDEWDGYAAIFNTDRARGQTLTIRQQCERNLAAVELWTVRPEVHPSQGKEDGGWNMEDGKEHSLPSSILHPPSSPVQLIESDAIEAAEIFEDQSVYFVFMDDHHTAAHIQREIAAWLPKITRPGWLGGHDFPGDIEAGVRAHFPDVVKRGNSWLVELEQG